MPAFGETALSSEEIWDLVNYVLLVPFEPKQPSTNSGDGKRQTASVEKSTR